MLEKFRGQGKGLIISGFGGVGKTTLARKYANVIDLESSLYKYIYDQDICLSDMEKIKGISKRKLNPNYPLNYIEAILEATHKYDIVCVRYNGDEAVDFYDTYNLTYAICYPSEKAYQTYVKRFEERGNTKEWIEKNKRLYYEVSLKRFEEFKGLKIELKDNQTLEDALKNMNIKLIPK